jgi:general stress protein 26
MDPPPNGSLDPRFSSPEGESTAWTDVVDVLQSAELYWLTTVRADGRPHVTPLIGVADGAVLHFCTGAREQKAHNLDHDSRVAMTTGNNTWAHGLDVVVEGPATRVIDGQALQRIADAYETKYGSAWHFDVGDGVFESGGDTALVFRVEPVKVLAFAKDPHAQTTYRLGDR